MTQGDIVSPVLFNIIVDRVVRNLYQHVDHQEDLLVHSTEILYADDVDIFGCYPQEVQNIISREIDLLKSFGL